MADERDRPDWSVVTSMMGDLRKALGGVADRQQRMLTLQGTAWSEDRTVKAVVGPRGQLVDLEIDPRVFRHPNSQALRATILATVRAAVDDVNKQAEEVVTGDIPADLRPAQAGGAMNAQQLLRKHDADLLAEGTSDE